MEKVSSQRLAVQRVMQANMIKYMQGIFSDIGNSKVIKSIQKYILDSDFLYDMWQGCVVDWNWEFSPSEYGEHVGFGEVIRSRDYYEPDEYPETYFQAPTAYTVKIAGVIDSTCVAKELLKNTPLGPYAAVIHEIVKRSDFAKLIVDALINTTKNYTSEAIEIMEDIIWDIHEDWKSEADEDVAEVELNGLDVKVKKGKVKSSGAQIKFTMEVVIELESENISLQPYEPDWD